ncbi:exosome 3'-_5 exonuclease subunit ski4 (Csl4) [Savitreella phatthalungensis]
MTRRRRDGATLLSDSSSEDFYSRSSLTARVTQQTSPGDQKVRGASGFYIADETASVTEGNTGLGAEEDVSRYGWMLLALTGTIFTVGLAGVLGVFDSLLVDPRSAAVEAGLREQSISKLFCFLGLLPMSGFVWTLANWLGLKLFRMTSSKV